MRPTLVLAGLLPFIAAKPTALRRDATSPVQARDALCGNNGYDKNNPVAFYVSQNPTDVTSSGCASLCRRAQGCSSFAFGAGYCLLYTAPVVDNLIPDPSSPYAFNDLACIAAVVPTSTAAVSTSSAGVIISPNPTTPGGVLTCEASTVTVSGLQLSGSTTTATGLGVTVTQTLSVVQVTTTTTETQSARVTTVTLSGSVSTLTLPAGTVTQTLPAVTATSTLTIPAVTRSTTFTLPAATSTLTLPAVTSTLTLPAVTSKVTVSATITNTATVTIRCLGVNLLCSTVT